MPTISVIYGKFKQGQPAVFTGRIRNVSGDAITQESLVSIIANIFDLRSQTPAVPVNGSPLAIDIPSTVSDVLQQNETLFPVDNLGWNFSAVLPQASFPNAGPQQQYRVEFVFTTTDQENNQFTVEAQGTVERILSSPFAGS
jgi:hypothetical protein